MSWLKEQHYIKKLLSTLHMKTRQTLTHPHQDCYTQLYVLPKKLKNNLHHSFGLLLQV